MYERIRNLREDRDWTQKQISGILNVAQTTYSRYELGNAEIPLTVLRRLALLHQTSIDYILELKEEKTPYPRSSRANPERE